ncbi:DUF2062 domain-containing protein [Paracoccus sp. XHP0099]|uniref:DUF2062 domain-containing protein n=2 Tax=Paracoccus marinaquae TaxID=2841926 RepID=A0ABS6AIB6_9RHOB|nr:DUF2062 domain-containing protein [Paracoccus marinaquae]MBU3030346.1 DUF2062 domain-containing protein [Paracoccus marinaquae]
MASDMIYPRGGWRRAATYVWHRLRRLPDQPHRIGRGVAAGVFVSFTPLFGFHFLSAAGVAWLIGGNILAALLATFVGNPVTFPFIAVICVGLGREILGLPGDLEPQRILSEITLAGVELWQNLRTVLSSERAHWGRFHEFFEQIYWPYMVGGVIIGLAVSIAAHYLTVPVFRAYQRRREKKMAERIARVRARAEIVTTATPGADGQKGGAAPRPADSPRDI